MTNKRRRERILSHKKKATSVFLISFFALPVPTNNITTGGPAILMLVCNSPLNKPTIAVKNFVRGNEILLKDIKSIKRKARLPAITLSSFICTVLSIHIPIGIPIKLARHRGTNMTRLSGCFIVQKRNVFKTRPITVSDETVVN